MSITQLEPVLHADWPHPAAFAVAVLLAWHSDRRGDVRMMQAEIARQLRTSRSTVSRELGRLIACGILEESRRNRWQWNADALEDLETALAHYPEVAGTPVTLRGVVKPLSRHERTPAEVRADNTRDTERIEPESPYSPRRVAMLTSLRAERAALEARHGEGSVEGTERGLELAPPHTDDDDCIGLDPLPVAVD